MYGFFVIKNELQLQDADFSRVIIGTVWRVFTNRNNACTILH